MRNRNFSFNRGVRESLTAEEGLSRVAGGCAIHGEMGCQVVVTYTRLVLKNEQGKTLTYRRAAEEEGDLDRESVVRLILFSD